MQKRNYGIDLSRLISMLMVVTLHTLGHGGILQNAQTGSLNYFFVWFIECACMCAVNCYAIISGYVGVNSKPRISKLLNLWLQIAFWTLSITAICFIIFPQTRGFRNLFNAFLPISMGQYWYLSSYFILYMLSPFLNKAIEYTTKKACITSLSAVAVIFFIPSIFNLNSFSINSGYTPLWLIYMYLVGGAIKKYSLLEKLKKSTSLLLFFLCVLVSFAFRTGLETVRLYVNIPFLASSLLTDYISPTMLLSAVFLFSFFSKINITESASKIISFLSPAALGVYIIHENPLIRDNIIVGFSAEFVKNSLLLLLLKVVASVAIIYITCLGLDLLRIQLFKLLKIKKLCNKFDKD